MVYFAFHRHSHCIDPEGTSICREQRHLIATRVKNDGGRAGEICMAAIRRVEGIKTHKINSPQESDHLFIRFFFFFSAVGEKKVSETCCPWFPEMASNKLLQHFRHYCAAFFSSKSSF